MKREKRAALKAGFIVAITYIVPIFVTACIILCDFSGDITDSDWVGFFGVCLCSVISSYTTLLGVAWTIRSKKDETQGKGEQQEKTRYTIELRNDEECCIANNTKDSITIRLKYRCDGGTESTGAIQGTRFEERTNDSCCETDAFE